MKITVEFDSLEEFQNYVQPLTVDQDKPKKTKLKKEEPTTPAISDNPLSGLTGGSDSTLSDLDKMLTGDAPPPVVKISREDVRKKAYDISTKFGKETINKIIEKLQKGYGVKDITQLTDDKLIEFNDFLDTLVKK